MRVSSESEPQNTNLQRDALQAAGFDARHVYEDRASRSKDDRPGLTQALEFLRSDNVLVVWKLDRLVRASPYLLSIVNTLKDKQVAFRSLTEGMDTTTASGELLFHVFGALAQFDRALTKERVTAGLAAARRRGRVEGSPPSITGEKLENILTALRDGMPKAAVCRTFGVKRTTLIRVDPISRTPYCSCRRSPRCQKKSRCTHRNTNSRLLSWCSQLSADRWIGSFRRAFHFCGCLKMSTAFPCSWGVRRFHAVAPMRLMASTGLPSTARELVASGMQR